MTVLQAIEGLTDRQAAEAVRTRIDWLDALALPLDDPGFDYSILSDFRQRLLAAQAVRSEPSVTLLRQVVAQHYEQQGQQVRWRDGPAVSNEQRIVSPHDPEARRSRKRDTVWLGYKVHLTETCDQDRACPHLISQVETAVATLQDSEVLAPIQDQLRANDLAPAEHYVDQGYPSGTELVKQAQLGTQIIGPVGQDPSWHQREQTGYAVGDFLLDWHAQVATCPQGHASVGWTAPQDRRGHPTVVIRFATATCLACPVREQCTRGQEGRTLTPLPPAVHAALQQRRAEQRTPALVQQYARRAGIEGTISQAVRTTRLRRTPYRGLPKTHLHAQSLGKPSRPARPKSPFARLQDQEAS